MIDVSPGSRELDRASAPGTDVPCPLKRGERIAMGRCVEWQLANGCHCEHALVAIRRVEMVLSEEPARVAKHTLGQRHGAIKLADVERQREEQLEALRGLHARAKEIEKQRPASPAKETTVAKETRKVCSVEGCGKRLNSNNKKGSCSSRCRGQSAPLAALPAQAVVVSPPEPAPAGGAVQVLEAELAQLRDRAARVERALEALRG
jgi:hypothetical protein